MTRLGESRDLGNGRERLSGHRRVGNVSRDVRKARRGGAGRIKESDNSQAQPETESLDNGWLDLDLWRLNMSGSFGVLAYTYLSDCDLVDYYSNAKVKVDYGHHPNRDVVISATNQEMVGSVSTLSTFSYTLNTLGQRERVFDRDKKSQEATTIEALKKENK